MWAEEEGRAKKRKKKEKERKMKKNEGKMVGEKRRKSFSFKVRLYLVSELEEV